jgi:hypothetical protein
VGNAKEGTMLKTFILYVVSSAIVLSVASGIMLLYQFDRWAAAMVASVLLSLLRRRAQRRGE